MTLRGDGQYNLNALKEVRITESYLGMDQDITGCQNEESYLECTTRNYLDTLMKTCECLPAKINLSNEVDTTN